MFLEDYFLKRCLVHFYDCCPSEQWVYTPHSSVLRPAKPDLFVPSSFWLPGRSLGSGTAHGPRQLMGLFGDYLVLHSHGLGRRFFLRIGVWALELGWARSLGCFLPLEVQPKKRTRLEHM